MSFPMPDYDRHIGISEPERVFNISEPERVFSFLIWPWGW